MLKKNKPEFWVANIRQDRDVALRDLRLTIRAGKTVNLLDDRHYHYTLEQLQKSAKSGSIFAKSRMIKVREGKPQNVPKMVREVVIPRILKPVRNKNIDVSIPNYEELDFVKKTEEELRAEEERLAAEMADAAAQDYAPILPVDKKFKED